MFPWPATLLSHPVTILLFEIVACFYGGIGMLYAWLVDFSVSLQLA